MSDFGMRRGVHEATLDAIRSELRSADPTIRAQAAEALAVLGDGCGLDAALASADPIVRRIAVRGVAAEPGDAAGRRIAGLCRDEDESVRCAVARALGCRGDRESAHVLTEMVRRDASGAVRLRAAVALAEGYPRCAETALRAAVDDVDPRVREAAAAFVRRREVRESRRKGGRDGQDS